MKSVDHKKNGIIQSKNDDDIKLRKRAYVCEEKCT